MIQKPLDCHGDFEHLPLIKSCGVSASSHSIDSDLTKVRSFDKQTDIFNILHSEDPDHYSRLWMVGFLKFVGYTLEEICAIIHEESSWLDYDRNTTWCQVRSVFRVHACKGDVCISSPLQASNGDIVTRIHKIDYHAWVCINVAGWRCVCHFKKCESCNMVAGSAVVVV